MPRVKGGTTNRARHKKILKLAKGYFGSKHRLYRTAHEQVMHSLKYAFRDRRQNKRNFRKLWITRINAACKMNDISYSKFIHGLIKANVAVNRKMLSEIAISDPKAFTNFVTIANNALAGKPIVAPKVTKVVSKKKAAKDLSGLTVAELRLVAKEKKIEGYTKLKKSELLEILK